MIDRFLKAKHWHLFLLTVGVPVLLEVVMFGLMFSQLAADDGGEVSPTMILQFVIPFTFIILLVLYVFYGWFWAVGIGLQRFVPEGVSMKVNRFKVFFFIPLIYIGIIGLSMALFFMEGNPSMISPSMILIMVMGHLFAMFCMFYVLYFVAKTFKTVELQREVTFGDYVGEFFLFWFYPVGVWVLQPKINKVLEKEN